MPSITIRSLDQALMERLRVRAARHGRSMEEEARAILQTNLVRGSKPPSMADAFREWFGPKHGVELELPECQLVGEPPQIR